MKRGGQKIKNILPKLLSFVTLTLIIVFVAITNVATSSINNTVLAKGKMSEYSNSMTEYEQIGDQNSNAKFVGVVDDGDNGTTDNSNNTTNNTSTTSTNNSSCEEGAGVFGWLLCPGQSLITTAIDAFLDFIENSMQYTFLVDDIDVQTKDGSTVKVGKTSIKEIWGKFVNIANIIFAVAFLIMIYSMATSTGLSNYHVKKILPRIIVMVVIVNLSFYICAAAADLSNIIGYNVSRFIQDIIPETGVSRGMFDSFAANLTSILVAVLSVLFFGGTLLISLVIIILAVAFRQVLLTVLVIISPIAFALYLLPNTERWGKKWTDLFVRLLIIYPAFGLVWGVSRLLAATFESMGSTASSSSIEIPSSIMSVVCGVAPALALIPLFKMSGSVMGAIIGAAAGSGIARGAQGKLNSMGSNAGKRLGRRMSRPGVALTGAVAGKLAKNTKDNGIIGLKARQAQAWANSKTTGQQERNIELAALNKKAGENAANIVGAMTQDEQLSALTSTNGKYTDRYGKEQKINLNDPYMFSALLTAQAPNLKGHDAKNGTNQLRDVTSATAARIEMLRNSNQNQAADALQAAAATALSSNQNSNLSTGQMHTVLSSGANAATQYNASVIDNAINKTVAEDIPKKSAVQIDEINNIMENHGSSVQKSDWNSINIEALSDSKISNKLNASQRQSVTYASKLY